ncbi:MAG TPA: metalloregulator ArsR/SmtB family transcription factor [Caulobacteraceae bacterium]|jgi:DNA-binding transcriptional ArsR family regulator
MRGLDATLAALADPRRRAVVDILRRGPRAAGDLARELGVSPSLMSRQLRELRESGLVEDSHPSFDTRVRIYSLSPAPMVELKRWLEETERGWSEQLTAFKTYLETKR